METKFKPLDEVLENIKAYELESKPEVKYSANTEARYARREVCTCSSWLSSDT